MAYTPSEVGYPCANTMRFRPEAFDAKRVEIYPLSQWGDWMPDYDGPENADLVSARACLRKIKKGQ